MSYDTVTTIRWQKKTLVGDISNVNQNVPSLGFSNLTIGRVYRINVFANILMTATNNNFSNLSIVFLTVTHNGIRIGAVAMRDDQEFDASVINVRGHSATQQFVFTASTTTLVTDVSFASEVGHTDTVVGSGLHPSFIILEELPLHTSLSPGGAIIPNVLGDNITQVKWQRKLLAASINHTGTTTVNVPSLAFNNLTIGKTYRITLRAFFGLTANSGLASDELATLTVIHNGVEIIQRLFRDDHEPDTHRRDTTYDSVIIFTATATTTTASYSTAVFNGSTLSLIEAGLRGTWITIEELPRHLEVSDF